MVGCGTPVSRDNWSADFPLVFIAFLRTSCIDFDAMASTISAAPRKNYKNSYCHLYVCLL